MRRINPLQKCRLTVFFILLLTARLLIAQTGAISGSIRENSTKLFLPGANVIITGTGKGTSTGPEGDFYFNALEEGTYTIKVSYTGYKSETRTDIIVRKNRTTVTNFELFPEVFQADEVTVNAGFFQKAEQFSAGTASFSFEEIRRAPGSAGDISRIIFSLPSIAKTDDQKNSLIVRGGSSFENSFYIDNIEIPNINHFPSQGSSGGAIGILNVDFLEDIIFFPGGFNASYGDKLSSVTEISFRDGNKSLPQLQLDLNFTGFGASGEGPLGSKGSWLFSARRSYLDLVVKAFDVGSSIAPRYGDYQLKTIYEPDSENKFSLLALWSYDINDVDPLAAVGNDMKVYGYQNLTQITSGINWRTLHGAAGFSNTSIAYSYSGFNEKFSETGTMDPLLNNNSTENIIKLRNVNNIVLSSSNVLISGFDFKYYFPSFDNTYYPTTDLYGNITPLINISTNSNEYYSALFFELQQKISRFFTANLGVRSDYFSSNERVYLSPRIQLKYEMSEVSYFNINLGRYIQALPIIITVQNSKFRRLKSPENYSFSAGYSHLLTAGTRLSIEGYYKQYINLPMDPALPGLNIMDEVQFSDGLISSHSDLNESGKAYAAGIEIVIQKKLEESVYGIVAAGYGVSKYLDLNDIWRSRINENKFTFSATGGYKPDKYWEFSGRFICAGGIPYTPFDEIASGNINSGVIDEQAINSSRYPSYHSLNLRFDRRFYFESSNLILYISVWNIYNNKNISSYYWKKTSNSQGTIYQWGLLPIFGIEYEF